jgi:DNA-binding beta-propeller fold protein YncE
VGSNNRIQKFDNSGNFIAYVGDTQNAANCSHGRGDGQFNAPQGVAVDSSDNIYVADTDNCQIQKFNSKGVFITKCNISVPLMLL